MAIEGNEQDQIVVIGDGVDSACLVKRLRKKVGCTDLVLVEEVKPVENKPVVKPVKEKPEMPRCQPHCHGHPHFVEFKIIDENSPSICCIM